MCALPIAGVTAGGQIIHRLIGGDATRTSSKRHVNMLAPAGLLTLMQRRQDRRGCIDTGKDIGDRHPDFCGWPSGSPVIDIRPDMP